MSEVPEKKAPQPVTVRRGARKPPEGVLARIIATTQDAVVFIDSQARVVEFNKAAESAFGYRANEVLGENVTLLMPEPYRGEHDEYLARYERTGQARAIGKIRTVRGRRKNGETFPLELSVTELPEGGPIRYAAFLRDISEKTALEQRALERERLASLGMAASILAHEIGNPLNNMYLEAQLLERRLKKGRDVDMGEARVSRIMEEIQRLVRLLEEFRSVSRAEQGAFEPCDLVEIGRHASAHLEEHARATGVRIEEEFQEEGGVFVDGNRDKLHQLVMNLAKNAVEAMPEGGTLRICVGCRESLALLEVQDSGIGLPEDLDFMESFQTTKPTGTGLGLAIVKQIVTTHRGSISWKSSPGCGTTFSIAIPLTRS